MNLIRRAALVGISVSELSNDIYGFLSEKSGLLRYTYEMSGVSRRTARHVERTVFREARRGNREMHDLLRRFVEGHASFGQTRIAVTRWYADYNERALLAFADACGIARSEFVAPAQEAE